MRRIYKARIVPDTAPDSLTTKVIKVEDLGVPVHIALEGFRAATGEEIDALIADADEYWQAEND